MQQSRYSDAIKTLHQHLYEHATDTEALYLLALCHLQMDAYKEAEETIESAMNISPDDDRFFYLKARLLADKKDYKQAGEFIAEAVAINPTMPHYFGVWSQILLLQRNYQEALRKAEEGLAFDPEDQLCLNMRSHALYNLSQKDEAFSGLRAALEKNPENAYTHANMGWKYLESGKHNEALGHFREALRLDPSLEWARNGMVQAMKSKYWLYRIFLQYSFFMARQSSRVQYAIIIGIFLLTRLASAVSPVLYLIMAVIILSTWLVGPVSNLFLRFNPYGRYLLKPKDVKVADGVGILLLTAVLAVAGYAVGGPEWLLPLGIIAGLLTLPVSSMETPDMPRNRWILRCMTIAIAVSGLAGVVAVALQNNVYETLLGAAAVLTFVYQWVANILISRER